VALRLLLDTNAVLYVLGGQLAEPLPAGRYFASVITEIELLSYPSLDADEERHIRRLLSTITLVGLTQEVKDTAIQLRRDHTLKLPDAIIVATALSLQADLMTNDQRLCHIPGLSCRQLHLKGS
jgi:predicted nucleic acid-binding protein